MKTRKYLLQFFSVLIISIICISLFFCKREEVILHGDLTGTVTDATTSEPIEGAGVKLSPTDDTTSTDSDGTYLFKNIRPGEYEIQASKSSYKTTTKNVDVLSAKTQIIDFTLTGIPVPEISVAYIDFGFDLTSLSFSISNTGQGKLTYVFTTSQDWITVDPISGDVTGETDDITVTIDKTGLSDSIYKETIQIISDVSKDTLDVYLNGLMDIDLNYYKVVTIGTQTWMAENLNVGLRLYSGAIKATDNGIIERLCYDCSVINCDVYGGLYQWDEMMQYNPSDTGMIGTTQGICPDGWHIPTVKEWYTLANYLGGHLVAGGKLKETGFVHWNSPNLDATNESGFTALPGGQNEANSFRFIGTHGRFWSATEYNDTEGLGGGVQYNSNSAGIISSPKTIFSHSVRCVKDTALVK